jgi:hypothetical protein
MKTKSIPHIWAILGSLILLAGTTYLVIGLLIRLYHKHEIIPPEGYFPFGVFSTFWYFIILAGIYFVKTVTVKENAVTLFFPFRFKKYVYPWTEISHCYCESNWGRWKNYESFHFSTSDGSTYMIMQFEYRNYKKLKSVIQSHAEEDFIEKFHNLKVVAILFLISIVLTISTISVYNGILLR